MAQVTREQIATAGQNVNVQAFSRVLREGETNQSEDAYRMVSGGGYFDAPPWKHPYECMSAPPGKAAGAFQFIPHTWAYIASKYELEDFSPQNQELGAIALIAEHGALDDVISGGLDEAIRKLDRVWVSLAVSKRKEEAPGIFRAYGGTVAGEGTGEVAPAEVFPAPGADDPPPTQEVKRPMPAILAAILPSLFQAAPDLIRLFGTAGSAMTARNAAVAQEVANVAVQVSGAVNEQGAAEAIANNPELSEQFRQAVRENFDAWMGMMVKFAELDEASKAKSRDFVSTYDRSPVAGKFTFVELLSLLMFTFSAVGGVLMVIFGGLSPELKGAIVTLMLIGGYNGVKEFWLGSSMGSMNKDARPK